MQEIEGTKAFTIEYGKKVGQLHCLIDVEYIEDIEYTT